MRPHPLQPASVEPRWLGIAIVLVIMMFAAPFFILVCGWDVESAGLPGSGLLLLLIIIAGAQPTGQHR
jgi:hypothetical protein